MRCFPRAKPRTIAAALDSGDTGGKVLGAESFQGNASMSRSAVSVAPETTSITRICVSASFETQCSSSLCQSRFR